MKIAFASGKGGTGKTTIATNLAAVLAGDMIEATYVDCDVEEPNGHIFLTPVVVKEYDVNVFVPVIDASKCNMCGLCAEVCQFNAVAVLGKQPLVFDTLCHSCGACVEFCPEHAITERPRSIGTIQQGTSGSMNFHSGRLNVGESMAPPVTKQLKRNLPDSKVIIIDAPPGSSCPVVEAVLGCDYVVLVTESTPFGLNDLELAHSMLMEMDIPHGVLINRADVGDDRVRRFCHDGNIDILLEIPFDRRTAEAYSGGQLAVDIDDRFAGFMHQLYDKINLVIENDRIGNSKR